MTDARLKHGGYERFLFIDAGMLGSTDGHTSDKWGKST
jgi:hypothetical protein